MSTGNDYHGGTRKRSFVPRGLRYHLKDADLSTSLSLVSLLVCISAAGPARWVEGFIQKSGKQKFAGFRDSSLTMSSFPTISSMLNDDTTKNICRRVLFRLSILHLEPISRKLGRFWWNFYEWTLDYYYISIIWNTTWYMKRLYFSLIQLLLAYISTLII